MTINATKTRTMTVGEEDGNDPTITPRGSPLEAVDSSSLGSEVQKNVKVEGDVGIRLKKASRVYQKWRKEVFQSRSVSKKTKLHVFQVMVMPVLLYGAETCMGSEITSCLPKEMPVGNCWSHPMG